MKKIIALIVFMLFFYPIQSFCKPVFNILDSECIVFIQGSELAGSIGAPLEVFLNTVNKANLQVWYIKSDQYSRIKFNNNTYLELNNKDKSSSIYLYKKGRSYYNIDLNDENLNVKVNKYFGRQIFPVFDKRSKTIYEKEYQGAIYIDYSEQELYELSNGYLDEQEYEVYMQTQRQMKNKLRTNMQILKIPYKEAQGNIKTIIFLNRYNVDLEDKGGNVILFIQGRKPYVVPLSSLDITTLNRFFSRGR